MGGSKTGVTNWESMETWQRLIAAFYAAGVKPDLKAVATYFGSTYDTVENRLRKIKKEGAALKEEVDSRQPGEVVPVRKSNPTTPRKPKTPRKDVLNTVANGRVLKSTPSKKNGIKQEVLDNSASSFFTNDTEGDTDSFQHSTLDSFGGPGSANLFDDMTF